VTLLNREHGKRRVVIINKFLVALAHQETLRRNTTATANLQHEASEIGMGPAGAGSETKGARRNRRAKTKKRSGAAPPSMSRRRRPRAATSFSAGCE